MQKARRRLAFATLASGALAPLGLLVQGTWLLAVATNAAGQAAGVKRIGVLSLGTLSPYPSAGWPAFLRGLEELGFVENRDFVFEFRSAQGKRDKLPELAAQLVATRPDAIVTWTTAATMAAKNATASVPIVFRGIVDPVGYGLVASLRRPGGNITGVSGAVPGEAGLDGKMIELIRDTLPASSRLGALVPEADPLNQRYLARISQAAASKGFTLSVVYMKNVLDLDRAFANVAALRLEALFIPEYGFFYGEEFRFAFRALKNRVALFGRPPVAYWTGGLMSLNIDHVENQRRAGKVVGRILKGENPAEIPVEQPERFYLTINLKTALALGITFPQSVMLRADRVIE